MTRKNEQLCFAEAPQRFSIMEKTDATDEPDHNERRWLCVVVLGIRCDAAFLLVTVAMFGKILDKSNLINRLQFLPHTHVNCTNPQNSLVSWSVYERLNFCRLPQWPGAYIFAELWASMFH